MKYLIVIMLFVLFSCGGNDGVKTKRMYVLVDSIDKEALKIKVNANMRAKYKLQGGVCVYKDEEGVTHFTQAMSYVTISEE